jgi:hypothetical protein
MAILFSLFGEYFYRNITTFDFPFKPPLYAGRFIHYRWLLFLLFTSSYLSLAGFERIPQPPAVCADGMSSLFMGDADAFLLNPSAAAGLPSVHASVFYSPSPFGLSQLSNGGLLIAVPTEFFETGLGFTNIGYTLYNELTATAVFAKSIGTISVGCNINYNHLRIEGYGAASAIGIDLAASIQLTDDIRWGVSLLNLNRPTIGREKELLPQWYLTGLTCQLLSTASVSLSMIKDVMYPPSVRTGVKFSPLDFIDLQVGASSDPSRYYAGIGINYMLLAVRYSVATHVDLGLTHTIGISFSL